MGIEAGSQIFLLINDGQGWISAENQSRINVPRGSLVELVDPTKEFLTSVEVRILDQKNVKMVPLTSDLKKIGQKGDKTYQLLRGIINCERRYQLVVKGGLQDALSIATGSPVIYNAPGDNRGVEGVVRYLGQGPQGNAGWVLGLEIKRNDWEYGFTNGVVDGKKYFDRICQEEKGVFCDMSEVKLCQKNCDTSNRPGQSIPRFTKPNNSIYSANIRPDDRRNGSSHSVSSHRANNNNNYLKKNGRDEDKKFLNKFTKFKDPGSESDPPPRPPARSKSGTYGLQRHSNRRSTEDSGDEFSWDPNKKKTYDKTKFEDRRGRQTPESSADEPSLSNRSPKLYSAVVSSRNNVGAGRVHQKNMYAGDSAHNYPSSGGSYEDFGHSGDGDRLDSGRRPNSFSSPAQHDGKFYQPDQRQSESSSRRSPPSRQESRSRRSPSTRQEGWSRSSPPSRIEDSSEISLDFIDTQESEDQWSNEQVLPLLVDPEVSRVSVERGSDDPEFPWKEQLSQPRLHSKEKEWGEHRHQERTWGEVLDNPSPGGSYTSNQSDKRLSEELPEFDQLSKDAPEDFIASGSMVQLERAGQPVFGVVRWRGSVGDKGEWVGVELEDEVPGGGTGQLQGRTLFSCPKGKGIFVPVTHIRPDPRFNESTSSTQEFGSLDCPSLPGIYPPHPPVADVSKVAGRNRGIQGHQNSCYLDATLFSMFTFTSVFDSLLYRPRCQSDIEQYEEVQRVLRDEIVNPLRRRLYVRADKVMALRTLLDNLSNVSGLMDQEKDPEEFLNSLLNQVLKANPYLELSSGQSSHTFQLFVEKDPDLIVPTLQELFDQSFLSSRVKLTRAPPVLILQMPRFGRQFKMYERVIPTQILDITDVISGIPRQCVICGLLANYECLQCYGEHEQGLQSTAFCAQCLKLNHQHALRKQHVHTKLESPPSLKVDCKLPRVCMELVAVICIETSHYVSFVRCGDSVRSPWAFFDSMADRKGEQNGYNIPELTAAPEVESILSEEGAAQLRENPNLPLSSQAKRLISDAYICLYQSVDVRMYK